MQQLRFSAGEIIFQEGDASDLTYLIWAGSVEVVRETPHGPKRIAVLAKDDFLGEMGVIEDRPRSATAIALEPTVCSAIAKEEFVEMLLERPQEAMDLLRVLFDRLRTMNDELIRIKSAPDYSDAPEITLTLRPLTAEMCRVLPEEGIQIRRLPYRIGRVPRNRASALLVLNELELPESAAFVVAPNHLAFERDGTAIIARDRGSKTGCLVGNNKLGAGSGQEIVVLSNGETEITLGRFGSPYRFIATLS